VQDVAAPASMPVCGGAALLGAAAVLDGLSRMVVSEI
jgi:hypothetical protein